MFEILLFLFDFFCWKLFLFCVLFIGFFDGFVGLVIGVLDVGGLYRIGWD